VKVNVKVQEDPGGKAGLTLPQVVVSEVKVKLPVKPLPGLGPIKVRGDDPEFVRVAVNGTLVDPTTVLGKLSAAGLVAGLVVTARGHNFATKAELGFVTVEGKVV
jgi:hypothetical protein